MYAWDPEGWYHDQVWAGDLVLEDTGCAYLEVTHRDGTELSEQERPIRSLLRLPSLTTSYHHGAGTLRVGDSEPVSPGDHISVTGTQGWKQEWNQKNEEFNVFHRVWPRPDPGLSDVCLAHVSFWVARMGPSTSGAPTLPTDPPPIAGMIQTDDSSSSNAISDWGVLEIEGRCLYLWVPDDRIPLDRRETPEFSFVRDGMSVDADTPAVLRRSFIRLGQPEVQFNVETQQLRVRGGAPMTTGDLVEVGGVLADGFYVGLDNYVEGCHAPSVIGPSFMQLCTPEPGFCHLSEAEDASSQLLARQSGTQRSSASTVAEDFYMEQYGVARPEARQRLARIPQLQALLDDILEIELDRLAGLGIDHYDTFGAWVWLTGSEPAGGRTLEIADGNPDLEVRTGAAHTYFELHDAVEEADDILGVGPITHESGGLDWLVHFIDVNILTNSLEIGVDPGHETRTLRISVDPDRPKATNEEVRAAVATIEEALEGRVSVPYTVTDGRTDALLATRRPAPNTNSLDRAYLRHQRELRRAE